MSKTVSYAQWSLKPYCIGMKLRSLRTQKRLTLSGFHYAFTSQLRISTEVPGDGGCGSHLGRDQVRASAASLAAFEVAVAGGGAALAGRENVGIHGQAHGAAGLAPVEAGFLEDAVQALGLGLRLDGLRAGNHHGADVVLNLVPAAMRAAARRSSMRPLVQEPMKTRSMATSSSGVPAFRSMYSSARSKVLRSALAGARRGRARWR